VCWQKTRLNEQVRRQIEAGDGEQSEVLDLVMAELVRKHGRKHRMCARVGHQPPVHDDGPSGAGVTQRGIVIGHHQCECEGLDPGVRAHAREDRVKVCSAPVGAVALSARVSIARSNQR
jgi:hypothetical protein